MALSATTREHLRWTADIAIALVLGTYAALDVLTSSGDFPSKSPALAVLVALSGYALVARRVFPVVGLVLSLGLLSLSCAIWGSYQAGSTLLIAIVASYSGLAYGVSIWLEIVMIGVTAIAFSTHHSVGEAIGGVVFVGLVCGIAAVGGFFARRYRALAAAEAARRTLTELESASTAQAAVDAERARVARELHDILSHSLGVVVLQTGAAEHAWDSDPVGAKKSVEAARHTALEAVDQLRALLSVVRDNPDGSQAPVPSLDQLGVLAKRSSHDGFKVLLDVEGVPRDVSPQLQASIYRVAQEGIANSVKHSGARGCQLRLRYLPDPISLEVSDDGTALAAGDGSRSGLVGIQERAKLFGGKMTAGPQPAGGWRLAVTFPG